MSVDPYDFEIAIPSASHQSSKKQNSKQFFKYDSHSDDDNFSMDNDELLASQESDENIGKQEKYVPREAKSLRSNQTNALDKANDLLSKYSSRKKSSARLDLSLDSLDEEINENKEKRRKGDDKTNLSDENDTQDENHESAEVEISPPSIRSMDMDRPTKIQAVSLADTKTAMWKSAQTKTLDPKYAYQQLASEVTTTVSLLPNTSTEEDEMEYSIEEGEFATSHENIDLEHDMADSTVKEKRGGIDDVVSSKTEQENRSSMSLDQDDYEDSFVQSHAATEKDELGDYSMDDFATETEYNAEKNNLGEVIEAVQVTVQDTEHVVIPLNGTTEIDGKAELNAESYDNGITKCTLTQFPVEPQDIYHKIEPSSETTSSETHTSTLASNRPPFILLDISHSEKWKTIITREYESEVLPPERRDVGTQMTGNHAAVQANVVPYGMEYVSEKYLFDYKVEENIKQSHSGEEKKSMHGATCSPNNISPNAPFAPSPEIEHFNRPSTNATRIPSPEIGHFDHPPTLSPTNSYFKQQIYSLQKQIRQKKLETERIVQGQLSYHYSSLRGTEQFIEKNRSPRLRLWQALLKVDPSMTEEKAREVARLTQDCWRYLEMSELVGSGVQSQCRQK